MTRPSSRHLQIERLEDASVPLHLVAFDLLRGRKFRLSDGLALDAVLTAAAIPGVVPNDRLGDRLGDRLLVLPVVNPERIQPTDFDPAGRQIAHALAAARTALAPQVVEPVAA